MNPRSKRAHDYLLAHGWSLVAGNRIRETTEGLLNSVVVEPTWCYRAGIILSEAAALEWAREKMAREGPQIEP